MLLTIIDGLINTKVPMQALTDGPTPPMTPTLRQSFCVKIIVLSFPTHPGDTKSVPLVVRDINPTASLLPESRGDPPVEEGDSGTAAADKE